MMRSSHTTAMYLICAMLLCVFSCTSGIRIQETESPAGSDPYLYVDGMHGVENLAFDGKGNMYVTGLDGTVYRVVPTENPYKGTIAASRKVGVMCLGVAVGRDGNVYIGVRDEAGNRKVARISGDLVTLEYVSGPIEGLNGFIVDDKGYLYVASSNESMVWPRGKIIRMKCGDDASFKNPEVFADGAGMVNGLAFSPDFKTLYYTETMNGVWAFDTQKKVTKRIYNPAGFMQVVDDITVASDGTIWFCLNSERLVVSFKNGVTAGYRAGTMGAPSSCEFGKGKGFREDFLYVTEFGLKGRSFTMDGRGVWVLPVR